MGEAETVEYIRIQLFGLAMQYQQLAEGLRSGRPLVGSRNEQRGAAQGHDCLPLITS